MSDYIVSARAIKNQQFSAEPGPSRFLRVPTGATPIPSHGSTTQSARREWFDEVTKAATWGTDERTNQPRGDILIHIHGYNNSPDEVVARHRVLASGLHAIGWRGCVVSFDWPSDNRAIGYLEDRHDAKQTAMQLVSDVVAEFSRRQQPDCTINVHALAHSMGAYVLREACDDADDARLHNNAWMLSQVCFIGADVSAGSMASGHSRSSALYRHCIRLTNYFSRNDSVLKLSNAKRIGVAPRVGRVGLPEQAPATAVNVDCTDYHRQLLDDPQVRSSDLAQGFEAKWEHSWFVGNKVFLRDLFETLKGDLDRRALPTRRLSSTQRGTLDLIPVGG